MNCRHRIKNLMNSFNMTHANFLNFLRTLLIIILAKSSVTITISWMAIFTGMGLAVTFVPWNKVAKLFGNRSQSSGDFDFDKNPFKGKVGPGYLTDQREIEVAKAIVDSVVYDAANVGSVAKFDKIKRKTECAFAKRARLWGSPEYSEALSLEENIQRLVPTFYKFTLAFQDLALDAFLIELPGKLYGENIEIFGDAVRRVLITLREFDNDRRRRDLMKKDNLNEAALKCHLSYLVEDPNNWNKRSWVFEFNRVTFFITTFAPFYPDTNSRFAFGSQDCYILFQPEISFAIHDLPPDTAETVWDHPVTVRDKIRVAFRDAGREYEVPMKLQEPMVCDIVKKIYPHDEAITWWLPNQEILHGEKHVKKE